MILNIDVSVAPEDLAMFREPMAGGTAEFVNGTRLVWPMEGKAMSVSPANPK